MEEQVICPWCLTEIVWDEEIGPEKRCPHCDNELSSYRTIELGYDEDEVEEDEYERARQLKSYSDARKAGAPLEEDDAEEEDEDEDEPDQRNWNDSGEGVRNLDIARFAVEENIQRVLDDQDEVPECPSCREYMLEAGSHVMNAPHFENRVAPSLGTPLLDTPFKLNLYVCPSCFQTASILSRQDQSALLDKLSPKD
jgi:hypothetical protein